MRWVVINKCFVSSVSVLKAVCLSRDFLFDTEARMITPFAPHRYAAIETSDETSMMFCYTPYLHLQIHEKISQFCMLKRSSFPILHI